MKKLVRMSSSRDLKKLDPNVRDEACKLIIGGEQIYLLTDEESIVRGKHVWRHVYYHRVITRLSVVWDGLNYWL